MNLAWLSYFIENKICNLHISSLLLSPTGLYATQKIASVLPKSLHGILQRKITQRSHHCCWFLHSLPAEPEQQQSNCHGPTPEPGGTRECYCLCSHWRGNHSLNRLPHLVQIPSVRLKSPDLEETRGYMQVIHQVIPLTDHGSESLRVLNQLFQTVTSHLKLLFSCKIRSSSLYSQLRDQSLSYLLLFQRQSVFPSNPANPYLQDPILSFSYPLHLQPIPPQWLPYSFSFSLSICLSSSLSHIFLFYRKSQV